MLRAYNQAVTLQADWEKGVPLEERGVAILESCLDMLHGIDGMVAQNDKIVFEQLPLPEVQVTLEPQSQRPASAAVVSFGDSSRQ